MVGTAHRAWAEQADIATVASVYAEQNAKASNPQAEETGSLDPPQQATAHEADASADNALSASVKDASNEASDSAEAPATVEAMRSAAVTLDSDDDGWACVSVEGAQEGDTLLLSVMGRADAIWTNLLLEAYPEANIDDLGDNQVEIRLAVTGESGAWELPGVMTDLVATAALLDSAGEMVAYAEGSATASSSARSTRRCPRAWSTASPTWAGRSSPSWPPWRPGAAAIKRWSAPARGSRGERKTARPRGCAINSQRKMRLSACQCKPSEARLRKGCRPKSQRSSFIARAQSSCFLMKSGHVSPMARSSMPILQDFARIQC